MIIIFTYSNTRSKICLLLRKNSSTPHQKSITKDASCSEHHQLCNNSKCLVLYFQHVQHHPQQQAHCPWTFTESTLLLDIAQYFFNKIYFLNLGRVGWFMFGYIYSWILQNNQCRIVAKWITLMLARDTGYRVSNPYKCSWVLEVQCPRNFAAPCAPARGAAFWHPSPLAPLHPCQPCWLQMLSENHHLTL